MERTVETKFYTVRQNNSEGYYIKNDDVAEYVIVEAIDLPHALSRLNVILKNYRSYCPCCGERWNDYYLKEEDGYKEPRVWGETLGEFKSWQKDAQAIVHYLDSTKYICNLENEKR